VKTKPKVSKSELESQAVRVRVMRIEPVEVARQWRGYGVAQAKDTADVPARVGATVIELPETTEVGRVVAAGQVLARLDDTDFRNTFDAAEKRIAEADALVAQLDSEEQRLTERLALEEQDAELARADYERQADRLEKGSATETDVDRSQRALINAERAVLATRQQLDAIPPRRAGLEATKAAATADRDTAKANLERTVITSPIAGVIESLDIEVGENLAPGARVARIVDPRMIEVPLQLPASARGYVTVGNTVTLTTRSQPADCPPWEAKVARIGVIDGPTRTFTVFAEIDQAHVPLRSFAEGGGPYKLPVGAFTLARLDTAEPATRPILPARAIQEGRVRTIVDGAVVSKPAEAAYDIEGTYEQFGVDDDQWVVLRDALEPGELVVLSASM
ncbi:MAG: HlyD family efflux transporter periplasmic adaptor subunit, partial [Pirellulales bacterium]|nr:HlyD family efflux transporter periplasmic adaptor subunit [Pirellulales bacterium]